MKIKNLAANERGFTLVEISVVTAILTVVLMAVYAVTVYSQAIFQDSHSYSMMTYSAAQTMRSISREIGQTSPNTSPSHLEITTDGSGNSVVAFQIPVDWDNDGDAVSGSLTPLVEWGAYNWAGEMQDGRLNDWAVYYVNNQGQLMRELRDAPAGAPYAGTERVISNNVTTFQMTQASDTISMIFTVQLTDTVGNRGTPKVHTQTFRSTTLLRNAVD